MKNELKQGMMIYTWSVNDVPELRKMLAWPNSPATNEDPVTSCLSTTMAPPIPSPS